MKNIDRVKSIEFIREMFSNYYQGPDFKPAMPDSIERREFGFLMFKEKMMIRHKSFTSPETLKEFIANTAPSDVYYSCAHYHNPEEEMDKKGWIKADVVFDIDADHLPVDCKNEHDTWVCLQCGRNGSGPQPQKCAGCGGAAVEGRAWICESCLKSAKEETIRLKELLIGDFGLEDDNLRVNFTGHRGYHVHIISPRMASLTGEERREIADYVSGVGFDTSVIKPHELLKKKALGESSIRRPTWADKVFEEAQRVLFEYDQQSLATKGLNRPALDLILAIRNKGKADPKYTKASQRFNRSFFEKIMAIAVAQRSSKIDTVVTTDVHRLIRLPGTLNGKTGLRAVEVDDLDCFDPLTESIAIKGEFVSVYVEDSPRFRLGEEVYGPFHQERVELPLEAAVYLLCKDRAKLG
ncbi:MAG: DNA primase small subunit domain-containing protein [Candidatus Bathyarchaeia archaeon]